jgi:hypothetical protein
MSFNRTVLTVATVVFIVMLTVTALMIKQSYGKKMYPPEIPKCPGQWEPQDNGSCKWKDENPNKSDSSFSSGAIYEPPILDNLLTRKEKCKWAKENNVNWEGIWDGVKGVKGC